MIASVLIHFVSCFNQFPVSISGNLIFSISLGLRKAQLFDLAYRLRKKQDVDRIVSDRSSNETDGMKNIPSVLIKDIDNLLILLE